MSDPSERGESAPTGRKPSAPTGRNPGAPTKPSGSALGAALRENLKRRKAQAAARAAEPAASGDEPPKR